MPSWLFTLYQLNPLAMGVEMAHYCFWMPVQGVIPAGQTATDLMPDHRGVLLAGSALLAAVVLALGQFIFHRLEGKFAQEL